MSINIFVESDKLNFLQEIPTNLQFNICQSAPKNDFFTLKDKQLTYQDENGPFQLSFKDKNYEERVKKATIKNELLLQILKQDKQREINDLTAGLAQESFLLAMKGHKVTMIEKSPTLFLLLLHAIREYDIADNLKLIFSDSINYLNSKHKSEICYADPMFKSGSLSGKVKKDINFLRKHAYYEKQDQLIKTAQNKAQKLILKLPKNSQAPKILGQHNYKITGKNISYYIFINN